MGSNPIRPVLEVDMYFWDAVQKRVRTCKGEEARYSFDGVHYVSVKAFNSSDEAMAEGARIMQLQVEKLTIRIEAINRYLTTRQ